MCLLLPLLFYLPCFAILPPGGLTENDFIIADRINSTDLTELLAKRKARFWA
jgi:hypothetical protein